MTLFSVEQIRPADRAEAESRTATPDRPPALYSVALPKTPPPVGRLKLGQCCKDTARSPLTRQAMAHADTASARPPPQSATARRYKRLFVKSCGTSLHIDRPILIIESKRRHSVKAAKVSAPRSKPLPLRGRVGEGGDASPLYNTFTKQIALAGHSPVNWREVAMAGGTVARSTTNPAA